MYTQSQAQFNTYVATGTILNNYAHIFDILIRLRQAVDHPYLVIHSNSSSMNDLKKDSSNSQSSGMRYQTEDEKDEEDGMLLCGFCHEISVNPCYSINCKHVYCNMCVVEYLNTINVNDDGNESYGDSDNSKANSSIAQCPLCNVSLSIQLRKEDTTNHNINTSSRISKNSIMNKIDVNNFKSSTKLEALMQVPDNDIYNTA
jgi:DNA repair protein RAD16